MRDLCTRHRACMIASDASSRPKRFHSKSLDRSIFEGINAVLSAFCATKPCLQQWDNGLQQWVSNGFTVRFVYRILEYSFVLGIFDSLGFRIFVLALVKIALSAIIRQTQYCWCKVYHMYCIPLTIASSQKLASQSKQVPQ